MHEKDIPESTSPAAPADQPSTSQPRTSRTKKVLLVTASVGSGHNQAARAIAEQMKISAPHVDLTCVDVLDFVSRNYRAKYAGGYTILVSKLPWLYGVGYVVTDRPTGPGRTLGERRRLFFERLALRKFGRYVRQAQPDLVLHTHFLAAPYLAGLCRRGKLSVRQQIITTDIMPHRWWYCTGIEHWYAGQDIGREILQSYGIEPQRITAGGIPVHPKWTMPLPGRDEILADWSLPADKQIVLLSGGTDFVCGPVVKIARQLAARRPDACLVVLAGRNKKLLGTLSGLAEARDGRIVPMGFTDRLHELVTVASLMVTKAGGMTTAECMAKSTPMVFLKPVPGQEMKNAQFVEHHGAGLITRNSREVIEAVSNLLAEKPRLDTMAQYAGDLYRPACQTITNALRESL